MRFYRKRQQGLTLITVTIILLLIAFFTTLILKIGPIYLNHSRVLNSLNAIKTQPGIEKKNKSAVALALARSFNINYVEHVRQEDITITKAGYFYVKVRIQYEVIEPLFGNLSVLVEFDDTIEVGEK